jgi:transcriptional regulator of nitric oxide reductase
VLAASVAGCGDEPPPPPRPPVLLALTAPGDMGSTREATVEVAGTVVPATARVIVLGERVAVRGGRFSTSVDLREGSNVIDVGASAPGRRATWRALRVTRRSLVRMPVLVGEEEDAARAALADLGLEPQVTNDDDLLDAFRRGPRLVCATVPEAGTELRAGAEVELVVSKTC